MEKRRSLFDRLADRVEKVVSHAAFFVACVLLIVLWVPLILFVKIDTWQLIINTATTIITFLLLALLTNTQRRFEERTDRKLHELVIRVLDAGGWGTELQDDPPCRLCGDPKSWHDGNDWAAHRDRWLKVMGVTR